MTCAGVVPAVLELLERPSEDMQTKVAHALVSLSNDVHSRDALIATGSVGAQVTKCKPLRSICTCVHAKLIATLQQL